MTKIAELISVYGTESDASSFFDTESDIFNILDYAGGATIYDGVTSAYTALNDAVSAANTSGGIVYIPTTASGSTYLIDSSITIPSNVKLKIQNGAILKLSSGSDMTINGYFISKQHNRRYNGPRQSN